MIAHLGGEVCEGAELDPEATHLLCAAPGRSEKMLGSIAAGRWVLHPVYIAKSRAAGSFLPVSTEKIRDLQNCFFLAAFRLTMKCRAF